MCIETEKTWQLCAVKLLPQNELNCIQWSLTIQTITDALMGKDWKIISLNQQARSSSFGRENLIFQQRKCLSRT